MRVSVVIPVYNGEKIIMQLVNSLLQQSFQDFEVIFVDDASNDNSLNLLKTVVNKYSKFELLEHTINEGAMSARRTGYMAAKGDYILFCDCDDLLPVDALEVLYTSIEKTKADIVIGQIKTIDNFNRQEYVKNSLLYGHSSRAAFKSLLKGELSHSLCGRIFRRLLFDESIICKKNFNNGEDGFLFYQLVNRASCIIVISNIVYYYRISPVVNVNSKAILTEQRAYNIIFFRNYISRYFKKDNELWNLYLDRYVVIIVFLLRKRISNKFILDNVGIKIDWRILIHPFKGMKKIFVLFFFYNSLFRMIFNKILD